MHHGTASRTDRERPRARARWLTVAFLLPCALAAAETGARDPHPISRFVVSQPGLAQTLLEERRRLHGEIRGAQVDRYAFRADAGDFVALKVAQRDQDMVAVLFGPDGRLIEIADRNNVGEEEHLTLVAPATGVYALQVAVFDWRTAATGYDVELAVREPAAKTPVARANQLLDAWYRPDAPGVAVAVLQGDRVLLERYIGLASVEYGVPITAKTKFDLASVSKQFTGFAIAMLIAEGRLSLDDDIRKYLPEVPDFGKTITIAHLLNHTSGLRDWDAAFGLRGLGIEDGITDEKILHFVAAQTSLNFAPGERQQYCNTGYNLLATIVSRAVGRPFDAWMTENVFVPLGMDGTAFNGDEDAAIPGRAASYEGRVPRPRSVGGNSTAAMGSSSLNATLPDLAKWLRNLETGRVGGARTLALYRTPGTLANGESTGYAFGNWRSSRQKLPMVGHLGLAAGYRTSVHAFPEQDIRVIFLTNDGDDAAFAHAVEIENLFLPVVAEPVETPPDDAVTLPPLKPLQATEVAGLSGVYYSDELGTSYEIRFERGELLARHAINGDIVLTRVEGDAFSAAVPYMSSLTFVRGSSGAAEAFLVSTAGALDLRFRRIE